MADLVFFSGTMDCGKSTLALQIDHVRKSRGQKGLIFTMNDRAGSSVLSSRLGLSIHATEVTKDTDFYHIIQEHNTYKTTINYIICDEAQFYSSKHIEQLADVVDQFDVDVFAFGITTDFKTQLFEGAKRLIELADRLELLQVEALCWCGRRATHNARTVDGVMVTEGEQVVVGDVDMAPDHAAITVGYETLCRRHHRSMISAHTAEARGLRDVSSGQELPLFKS